MRLVLKFGGTSVGSASAMQQAADIVAGLRSAGHELAVVTSAMSGVTDRLLSAAQAAVQGRRGDALRIESELRETHERAATELGLQGSARAEVLDPIDTRLAELRLLCDALAVLGEASPRALDAVASLGERMSIHPLAAIEFNPAARTQPLQGRVWLS